MKVRRPRRPGRVPCSHLAECDTFDVLHRISHCTLATRVEVELGSSHPGCSLTPGLMSCPLPVRLNLFSPSSLLMCGARSRHSRWVLLSEKVAVVGGCDCRLAQPPPSCSWPRRASHHHPCSRSCRYRMQQPIAVNSEARDMVAVVIRSGVTDRNREG